VNLDATISPEAAIATSWDAVVVGAGPAGAMAARELARQKASVLLVDRARFPRFKVCGGCLNPRSLRFLQNAGLGDLTRELGAVPLTRFRLASRSRFAEVPLPTGAGISREVFDVALIRAAIDAGAEFLPNTSAASPPVALGAQHRHLHLRNGGRDYDVETRVVLAAGGLGSKLEQTAEPDTARTWEPDSRIGAGVMVPTAPDGYEPHVIYMAAAREGYVGLVIVEDGRVDVAAALDPAAVKQVGGTGELSAQILAQSGFPEVPGLAALPWKGTPHLTRQAPRLGGERLFVLGDAAGYIEPFTGEGMAWALAGASAVAPLAMQTIRDGWKPALLNQWRATYRKNITRRQFVCRLTANMLRRPLATRVMVQGLSILPVLARPFLRFMYRS
jgi:flavin-dependent dehydrogenase